MFFLRGGRLFSEVLKRGVITNNSNTKPVFCNSVFATPQIWLSFYFLFVRRIPSTISCREKQFLFLYFLGEKILQNTNCETLNCERQENCGPNHGVIVLQETPANSNKLFCFSYQLHNINVSFRRGKCLFFLPFSHTCLHTLQKFLISPGKMLAGALWSLLTSRLFAKTSNLGHQAACSSFVCSFQEQIRDCLFIAALMTWGKTFLAGTKRLTFC